MADNILGRVRGAGFFGSTSESETSIAKATVQTNSIAPLVGDTIVNAKGDLCKVGVITESAYSVSKYGSIKGPKGDTGDSAHPTYYRISEEAIPDQGIVGSSYTMNIADLKPSTPAPAVGDTVIFKTNFLYYVGVITEIKSTTVTVKAEQVLCNVYKAPLVDLTNFEENGEITPEDYDLVIRTQEEFESFYNSLDWENPTCSATSVLLVGDGGTKVFNVPLSQSGTVGKCCHHAFEFPSTLKKIHGLNNPIIKMAGAPQIGNSSHGLFIAGYYEDLTDKSGYSMKNITFDVVAEKWFGVDDFSLPQHPATQGYFITGFQSIPYIANCHLKLVHGEQKKTSYYLGGIANADTVIDSSVYVSSYFYPFGISAKNIINCTAELYIDGPTQLKALSLTADSTFAGNIIINCKGLYKVGYTQESFNEYVRAGKSTAGNPDTGNYDIQTIYDTCASSVVFEGSGDAFCRNCSALPEHDFEHVSVFGGILIDPTAESLTILKAHPIGSYYISNEPTHPSTLFGGSWTSVTGRFLYCNAGTGTGGSNTVTLTVDQMPPHNHDVDMEQLVQYTNLISGGYGYILNGDASPRGSSLYNFNKILSTTGGGKSFNNMPAYQTVYAWRRTA